MFNVRPLRPEQFTYAALDAFCLLEVFEAMRDKFKGGTDKFNEIVEQSMAGVQVAAKINWKQMRANMDDDGDDLDETIVPIHPIHDTMDCYQGRKRIC